MGFIGVAVGLVIGILIYSEVEQAIDCPDAATNADGNTACTRAKSIAWTVISILPITMFCLFGKTIERIHLSLLLYSVYMIFILIG